MPPPASEMRWRDSPPLLRRAIAVSLIAACAMPLVSLAFVFPMVNELPRWDQWSLIPLWEAHCADRPVLPLLLEPYNGHVNSLTRFVFYAAGVLTGWDLRVEVLLIYLVATLTAATIVCMLRDSDERLLVLAAPAVAVAFSFVHFETFLTGYNLGQQLEQLFTTVCLFLLTRPRLTARHVLGGVLAAVAATFAWGGGLVAWPLGFVALAARRRPAAAAAWIVPAALCVLATKLGAVGGAPLPLSHLLKLLDPRFIFTMLGKIAAVRAFPEPSDALPLGIALTVAFFLGLAWACLSRRWLLALRWGVFGATAFGKAALISLSRSLAGLQQALVSHYATATYPLALAVLVFAGFALLLQATEAPVRLRRRAASVLLAGLIAVTVWQIQRVSRETYLVVRGWHAISVSVDEKLLAGTVTDPEIQGALHPDTRLVRHGMEVLRDCGLTVFDDGTPPP